MEPETTNKSVYPVNVNTKNDLGYAATYSRTPCAQPLPNQTSHSQRHQPQHFLPPYGMSMPMANNMPQQLMYNTQNQPMYNIMYGPQTMYRNQGSFSSGGSLNSFNQQIDTSSSWMSVDSCGGSTELNSKENYGKYDNKLLKDNCCAREQISCSKNLYYNKNSIVDSQWFYPSNYDNQKYNELPSCSQMSQVLSSKSVKYCSIQKYSETDTNSKVYCTYPNKYENHDLFANPYGKVNTKEYPSCSQIPFSNNSTSCLEMDKKILEHCNNGPISCDLILPSTTQDYYQTSTVLEHFAGQKIEDNKINEESNGGGGESDIVVEESDEEVTDDSEELEEEKDEIIHCLVCNVPTQDENQFYILTTNTPLTSYSQSSITQKLFQILGTQHDNQSNRLCTSCLNIINALDNLEMQLNNVKQDLIDKYKSTIKALKICVNQEKTNAISNNNNNTEIKSPLKLKQRKRKYKNKNNIICGVHSFKCRACEKIFSLKKFYKYHMSKHKIKNKYLCDQCGCNFIKLSSLKKHLSNHNHCNLPKPDSASIKFICHICGKVFKTKTNLTEHENVCSGSYPFSCIDCDKRFPSRTKLKQHEQLKHEKNYIKQCEKCGKGFVKLSDYKTHLLTHSTDKNFQCLKCKKTYKTLSNLNQHLKSHSDNLPYNCEVCNKGFLRKENLDSHVNIHNGVKPFVCPICEKRFASQKNLDAHLKVHQGTTKKKTCTVCGKKISHGLEDHMRTHSAVKEVHCDICTMKFLTKGALAKHKKRKHDSCVELDIL